MLITVRPQSFPTSNLSYHPLRGLLKTRLNFSPRETPRSSVLQTDERSEFSHTSKPMSKRVRFVQLFNDHKLLLHSTSNRLLPIRRILCHGVRGGGIPGVCLSREVRYRDRSEDIIGCYIFKRID